MSDLIDRQAAIDALKNRWKKTRNYEGIGDDIAEECELYLKQLPSAQSERPNGHWVEIGDEPYDEWECDVCGFVIDGSGCVDPEEYRDVYKYCPRCGSDMRGGQE